MGLKDKIISKMINDKGYVKVNGACDNVIRFNRGID